METLAFIISTLGTISICIPSFLKGKNMQLILLFVFSANILVATSYLLTGESNGAVSCFIGGGQTIINYFFDRKNKPLPIWLIVIYALAFILMNMLVFEVLEDLVAMLASLSFILCIGQKNGTKYRLCTVLNSSLWMTYDLISSSYGPLLTHGILFASSVFGIIVHDIRKKTSV